MTIRIYCNECDQPAKGNQGGTYRRIDISAGKGHLTRALCLEVKYGGRESLHTDYLCDTCLATMMHEAIDRLLKVPALKSV